MVRIDLLTEEQEDAYEDFLKKCTLSSVQYSLNWRNAISDLGKDEPYFVVARDNNEIVGVLPLYYYKSKLGNLLTTIAWHTISGIMLSNDVIDKETERERYVALLDFSTKLAEELDCVAVSIATNPFLHDRIHYLEHFRPDYEMENFIQYIKLNEIFDKQGKIVHPNYVIRSNLRRNLRKAELQGTIISDGHTKDSVEDCYRIYFNRLEELHATPIPREALYSIYKNIVCKGKGKLLSASNQGRLISAALVMFTDTIIDAYMMCMDSKYGELRSNYLIIYEILKWASRKGISILNWQSAPSRVSGVYKWKEQWGSHELTLSYLTKILSDISEWRKMRPDELREAYSFHYLLPFNLLKGDSNAKFTTKDESSRFLSQ